ncbi:hypothetical protein Tco_0114134 [Tanacetum coccineum]
MTFEHCSSSLGPQCHQMTFVYISSGLALQGQMASADNTSSPSTSVASRVVFNYCPSPSVAQPVLEVAVQDTPSPSISQTIKEAQSHVIPTSVKEDDHGIVIEVAHMDNDL